MAEQLFCAKQLDWETTDTELQTLALGTLPTRVELEMELRVKGRIAQADSVKIILPAGVECIFVRQPELLGLGHAVLCAERAVGNYPFAVLLADDFLTYGGSGVTAELVRACVTSGRIRV